MPAGKGLTPERGGEPGGEPAPGSGQVPSVSAVPPLRRREEVRLGQTLVRLILTLSPKKAPRFLRQMVLGGGGLLCFTTIDLDLLPKPHHVTKHQKTPSPTHASSRLYPSPSLLGPAPTRLTCAFHCNSPQTKWRPR